MRLRVNQGVVVKKKNVNSVAHTGLEAILRDYYSAHNVFNIED